MGSYKGGFITVGHLYVGVGRLVETQTIDLHGDEL
jgi:hypothetical protein